MDNDKITAACVNIVYYIITPSMKGKPKFVSLESSGLPTLTSRRPLDVDDIILQMILEMSRIPAALKAWRSVVSDILSDNRFFNSPLEAGRGFRSIARALVDTDKTAFTELLGVVSPIVFHSPADNGYRQSNDCSLHQYFHKPGI